MPGVRRNPIARLLGLGEPTITDFVGAAATMGAANLAGLQAQVAERQREVAYIANVMADAITSLGGNAESFKGQVAYLATKIQGDPGVQLKLAQVATMAAEDHLLDQILARRASRTDAPAEPPTA